MSSGAERQAAGRAQACRQRRMLATPELGGLLASPVTPHRFSHRSLKLHLKTLQRPSCCFSLPDKHVLPSKTLHLRKQSQHRGWP